VQLIHDIVCSHLHLTHYATALYIESYSYFVS
jgi:hypothetical protein